MPEPLDKNEPLKKDSIRRAVRDRYAGIAAAGSQGCGCGPSCCGPKDPSEPGMSARVGYSTEEMGSVPPGADMGLGCGNPQAIAALKKGETVLDLGSGGGFDCFLAADKVGPAGRVIGVDMTAEMLATARRNAAEGGYANVEFRLGEIEHLPVADASVDVIISNCVLNLSPDKPQVFRDAFRVLRPGGRLAVSDVVATREMPAALRDDLAAYTGCVAGAETVDNLRSFMEQAGFADVRIIPNEKSREVIRDWFPGSGAEDYVVSAAIEAVKPPRP